MKKYLVYGFAAIAALAFAFSGVTKSSHSLSLTELKAQAVEKLCETASTECETPQGVYSQQKKVAPVGGVGEIGD